VSKDNMIKRIWVGIYSCWFCHASETIEHLLFECSSALVIWSIVSTAICAFTRPTCFTQYFWWIANLVPMRTKMHIVCVAVLCLAVWKTRNRVCNSFPLKLNSFSTCVLFSNKNNTNIKAFISQANCG
jgi:hypothetical protein